MSIEKIISYSHNSINFLNAYKMAIDETSIVSKTDLKGIITYVNKQFCEISEYNREELIGRSHNIIRHPDTPKEIFRDMWRVIRNKKIWKGIIKNRTKSGKDYTVNATIIPVLDMDNNIIEYIAVRHDITELMKTKEKLAKHKIDGLTKLANKNAFLEDIKRVKKPILFYLNIDDFMKLNNLYGNRIGDRVLIHMAKLLRETLKDMECLIYRIYNDEFLVVFESNQINIDNYKRYILNIIDTIEKSTIECNVPECISFTLSGGVSYYLNDKNYENLSLYASIARDVAKNEKKKFLIYNHNMQNREDYDKNIAWIKSIKKAIENNKFIPYFQPILDNKNNKITKYESLIRMIDDNEKIVSPFLFLEIAKKAKLYSKITKLVIDKTLKVFKDKPEYECSINLTTDDIMNNSTRKYIYNMLENYPYPQNIIFEIIETEEIIDFKLVNSFIERVKRYGVKIAIDDFGTGYANFKYVIDLSVDYIKIDGSLIKNIETNRESKLIVEAIIAFSKKLGIKTIVEFVSTKEIFNEIKSLGADYSQGYYIGKPKATLL